MQVYEVGASVRDALLGYPAKHRNYLVTRGAPDDLLRQGLMQCPSNPALFVSPDGEDFYSLEPRPDTLETRCGISDCALLENLRKRDLTINAMARSSNGVLLDPFGGQRDLQNQVLRHTGKSFAENPQRIFRVARLLARFGPFWKIAPETIVLMHDMVRKGALDKLSPDNIWKEMSSGLMEPHPILMVRILCMLNVFRHPSMVDYQGVFNGYSSAMQEAAVAGEPLAVRFALAFPRCWTTAEGRQSRIPYAIRQVTEIAKSLRGGPLDDFHQIPPDRVLRYAKKIDAFRKPEKAALILKTLAYTEHPATPLFKAAVAELQAKHRVASSADSKGIQP